MNNREEEANQLGDLVLCKASEADLDYITRIAQAALPEHYRFPYRKEYPEDNWKWTRSEYEKYLNQPNKYAVLVVTASVKKEVGSTVKPRPIAYAVWDIDVGTKSPAGVFGIGERKDGNPRHMKEFQDGLNKAFTEYFSKYGGNQLHLWLLATHPDFRRHGAATMLCNWGLDKAQESTKNGVLSVFASPLGKRLYERLGFETLGSFLIQVDGEEEKLRIECMLSKLTTNEPGKRI